MTTQLDGKTLLLVDDDEDILTAMQAAFEPTGATIETASDGNTAVQKAETATPDLIVLDMMLPKRSGFLVLERIKGAKKKGQKPHVIMITGNQGQRHKVYAESLGVDAYLNKPFRMERLIELAGELLG